jgi:DNA polymerase III alpha subunit (gram-positive type)
MKVVSIDIETTGLDPNVNDVIQFGACIFDLNDEFNRSSCQQFLRYIWCQDSVWSPQAVIMNADIAKDMMQKRSTGDESVIEPGDLMGDFKYWLSNRGMPTTKGITVAGKNFMGFDQRFLLNRIPNWSELRIKQRSIDIASHFWEPGDAELPTLQTCLDRAKISRNVDHTALSDALDVAQLVHMKLSKK